MERLKHRRTTPRTAHEATKSLALLLLATVVLTTTACGPKVIKGRPPFIGISGMSLVDGVLNVEYAISNQNGVAMNIESIEISVTVNGNELTAYSGREKLLIDANSTEEIRLGEPPEPFTDALLTSLGKGELNNVSFDLEGRVQTREDGMLRSEHKGYLYPVPGKPGHFRAAVTQAKGLVREDPL